MRDVHLTQHVCQKRELLVTPPYNPDVERPRKAAAPSPPGISYQYCISIQFDSLTTKVLLFVAMETIVPTPDHHSAPQYKKSPVATVWRLGAPGHPAQLNPPFAQPFFPTTHTV